MSILAWSNGKEKKIKVEDFFTPSVCKGTTQLNSDDSARIEFKSQAEIDSFCTELKALGAKTFK